MKFKYFFLLLLTLAIDAQATIRYVSKTGNSTPPYTSWATAADSIQKCINICVDGDTVYVANGVYKENLAINTAISLIGSSMDSTVIDGTELLDKTIDFIVSGNIKNFTVFGKGTTGAAIWANDYLEAQNIRIKNTGIGVVVLSRSSNSNNIILNDMTRGFDLGCFIDNCSNSISNCSIILDKENSNGISISLGGEYFISDNIILFTGQTNPLSGISVGGPKSIYITNNLISGFTPNVYFDSIFDTSYIYNNLSINSNSNIGSIFLRSSSMVVENNIFNNNKAGLRVYNDPIHQYNLYWKNQTNILDGSLNDSDIVADPMFVKDTIPTANGGYDFHLQKYAPGIDKGDPSILDVDGSRSDISLYGGPFGETYTYLDLAPLPPRNLSAVVDSNNITVRWNRNTEADTAFYKVYRDTVINFTIDSTKLVSSSADTFYVQQNPHNVSRYVYRITCVDNQGNESQLSPELVVNVVGIEHYPQLAANYLLYQNYPNPFNPSTKIGYQLKERAYVKLMVYDIKGELVSVLVNKEQNAGYYEAVFSSSSIQHLESSIKGIASGIYLYRIEVIGEGKIPVYTEMKKMILVK